MILSLWATFRALPRGWHWLAAGVVAAALIGGLYRGIAALERADDRRNQEIGAQVQRETDLRETLERTEKGNAARDEVRNDVDGARYAQCLRTARTPANCERFLPQRQADQR